MLEIARIVLYIAEWLMAVIVWGGTADKLDNGGVCYFGKQVTCSAIVFFGVVAWLALNFFIFRHILGEYFVEKYSLRKKLEFYGFAALTAVWAVTALVATVGNPGSGKNSIGNAVVGFSWINIVAHAGSASIAFFENRAQQQQEV